MSASRDGRTRTSLLWKMKPRRLHTLMTSSMDTSPGTFGASFAGSAFFFFFFLPPCSSAWPSGNFPLSSSRVATAPSTSPPLSLAARTLSPCALTKVSSSSRSLPESAAVIRLLLILLTAG